MFGFMEMIITIVTISGWLVALWGKAAARRRRARLRAALAQIGADQGLALCIWAGRSDADPRPDVRHYVAENLPGVTQLLEFTVPPDQDLADPQVAAAIVQDLRGCFREIGAARTTHLHIFQQSLVAYGAVVGELVANRIPATIYHWQRGQGYLPLYVLNDATMHDTQQGIGSIAGAEWCDLGAEARARLRGEDASQSASASA